MTTDNYLDDEDDADFEPIPGLALLAEAVLRIEEMAKALPAGSPLRERAGLFLESGLFYDDAKELAEAVPLIQEMAKALPARSPLREDAWLFLEEFGITENDDDEC